MSKTNLDFTNGTSPAINATNLDILSGGVNDANTYYTAGGTANAITVTTGNGNYGYVDGVVINFKASNDNTGATTINVDGQGLKDLRDEEGVAFAGGEIESGKFYTFVYNSTAGNFTYAPKGANPIKSWNNSNTVVAPRIQTKTMVQRLSVTGSGWIISIEPYSTSTSYLSVEIDGSFVIGSTTTGALVSSTGGRKKISMYRFESSFKLYSDVDNIACAYVLGDSLNKATPSFYTSRTASTSTSSEVSVTGSGWIYEIIESDLNVQVKLTIDSTVLIDSITAYRGLLLYRFENSFDFETSTANRVGINYVLD